MSKNIHGYCAKCKVSFDGDLIMDYPLSQGKTVEEAETYAKHYGGWAKYKSENRWDRRLGIYNIERDRTIKYRCPDCGHEWDRL